MIATENRTDVMAEPLRRVRQLLRSRGYGRAELDAIADHCRQHGTSEGCPGLEADDAYDVESLLPLDPSWHATDWDAEAWTPDA